MLCSQFTLALSAVMMWQRIRGEKRKKKREKEKERREKVNSATSVEAHRVDERVCN